MLQASGGRKQRHCLSANLDRWHFRHANFKTPTFTKLYTLLTPNRDRVKIRALAGSQNALKSNCKRASTCVFANVLIFAFGMRFNMHPDLYGVQNFSRISRLGRFIRNSTWLHQIFYSLPSMQSRRSV